MYIFPKQCLLLRGSYLCSTCVALIVAPRLGHRRPRPLPPKPASYAKQSKTNAFSLYCKPNVVKPMICHCIVSQAL